MVGAPYGGYYVVLSIPTPSQGTCEEEKSLYQDPFSPYRGGSRGRVQGVGGGGGAGGGGGGGWGGGGAGGPPPPPPPLR